MCRVGRVNLLYYNTAGYAESWCVDWVSCYLSYVSLLSMILELFFSVGLSLILMNLDMNDIRQVARK